jgi:hypothetical protein
MRETLELLAIKGFAPIPKRHDTVAEVGGRSALCEHVKMGLGCMQGGT